MADSKHDQASTLTRRTALQAGALLAAGMPLFWAGEARAFVDRQVGDAIAHAVADFCSHGRPPTGQARMI